MEAPTKKPVEKKEQGNYEIASASEKGIGNQ